MLAVYLLGIFMAHSCASLRGDVLWYTVLSMVRKHIIVCKYASGSQIPDVESLEDSLSLHPVEEVAPKQK
jgi:hypothetical protein